MEAESGRTPERYELSVSSARKSLRGRLYSPPWRSADPMRCGTLQRMIAIQSDAGALMGQRP